MLNILHSRSCYLQQTWQTSAKRCTIYAKKQSTAPGQYQIQPLSLKWLMCLFVFVCVSVQTPPPHPSTLLVAQCGNLYHTGCFLIQHDLSPGCHPAYQENHHDSQAMISGGTVGEERPRGLLEAHLLWTRLSHISVVLLQPYSSLKDKYIKSKHWFFL